MRFAVLAAAAFGLAAAWSSGAEAGGPRPYHDNIGRAEGHAPARPYVRAGRGWNIRAQMDRPGDYRCDAYWDANRTDCGVGWRDQRHRVRYGAWNSGYGQRWDGRHGYADHGYGRRAYGRRGYGHAAYGQAAYGADAWYGEYGRPDLVYPAGGRNPGYGGRDAQRVRWCASRYRSYDPASGYYRAYSGRLIYCG